MKLCLFIVRRADLKCHVRTRVIIGMVLCIMVRGCGFPRHPCIFWMKRGLRPNPLEPPLRTPLPDCGEHFVTLLEHVCLPLPRMNFCLGACVFIRCFKIYWIATMTTVVHAPLRASCSLIPSLGRLGQPIQWARSGKGLVSFCVLFFFFTYVYWFI